LFIVLNSTVWEILHWEKPKKFKNILQWWWCYPTPSNIYESGKTPRKTSSKVTSKV